MAAAEKASASDKAAAIRYLCDFHYSSNVVKFSEAIGISARTIESYINETKTPHNSTMSYIFHSLYTPEFAIIVEYAPIEFDTKKKDLDSLLGENGDKTGIYSFYDSSGNLCYIGKASVSLKNEIWQSLRQKYDIPSPPELRKRMTRRKDVVRYISAYYIKVFETIDYARHVESLFLRVGKPKMNKISGSLEKAYSSPKIAEE